MTSDVGSWNPKTKRWFSLHFQSVYSFRECIAPGSVYFHEYFRECIASVSCASCMYFWIMTMVTMCRVEVVEVFHMDRIFSRANR